MVSSSSATSGGDRPTSGGSGGLPPPQAQAEWAASMQAYYAAATSAAGHPYVAWPAPQQQQCGLMTAGTGAGYGAPVPFPLYHHPAAAYYAHASMAAGMPQMAGEAASAATKGKRKKATRRVPSGEGASSSGSGNAGSQGSSEKEAAAGDDHKGSSSTKRIKSVSAHREGETSQAATTMRSPVTEPTLVEKGRSESKLSVTAAMLPNAAPTLNTGMDPRSASPSVMTPSGQGEVNAAASSQSNGSLSLMDERELKRERRKQSNRDSARRSRLRKQGENRGTTSRRRDTHTSSPSDNQARRYPQLHTTAKGFAQPDLQPRMASHRDTEQQDRVTAIARCLQGRPQLQDSPSQRTSHPWA